MARDEELPPLRTRQGVQIALRINWDLWKKLQDIVNYYKVKWHEWLKPQIAKVIVEEHKKLFGGELNE